MSLNGVAAVTVTTSVVITSATVMRMADQLSLRCFTSIPSREDGVVQGRKSSMRTVLGRCANGKTGPLVPAG
ncbi:hypothetical protein GCM10010176_028550 [Nonomuraea spiralis]|nr:hypothetical protein GCM10010176_028550 [Nonomuraea spiralis]